MLVNAVTASLICSPSTEIPLPQCFDVQIKHCSEEKKQSPFTLQFLGNGCLLCCRSRGVHNRVSNILAVLKMRRKIVSVYLNPFCTHVTGSMTHL